MRTTPEFSTDLLRRIDARTVPEPNTGCWLWTGSNTKGYATFCHEGKFLRISRVNFRRFKGDIPEGYVVRHTCDQPLCVNPSHLLIGTQADNMRDRDSRGRGWNGSKKPRRKPLKEVFYPNRKLTRAQDEEIKALYALGCFTKTELAKRFAVTKGTIRFVLKGRTW